MKMYNSYFDSNHGKDNKYASNFLSKFVDLRSSFPFIRVLSDFPGVTNSQRYSGDRTTHSTQISE